MKIKFALLTLFLMLFLPVLMFGGIKDDAEIKRALAEIDLDKKLFFGVDLGVGGSKQMSTAYKNGESVINFSYQIGVSMTYFLNRIIAFQFELGNHFLRCKDEDKDTSEYITYDLQYIFLSFVPLFRFGRFFFSVGFYFGFIVKSELSSSTQAYDEHKYYNIPDIGLKISMGYIFNIGKNMEMSLGIQTKIQLQNFRVLEQFGGQIFAFFFQTGLLFET